MILSGRTQMMDSYPVPEALARMRELGFRGAEAASALGCNMDTGHAFLCDADPLASIRELGDRIFHAHLENMRRGVHDHRLPDEGDMDLASYFRTLAEVGFSGVAALDLYGYDYEAVAPEALREIDRMRRSVNRT